MIEINRVIKCNKCKRTIDKPWIAFHWKDESEVHLCKECTRLLNKWFKEPVEVDV